MTPDTSAWTIINSNVAMSSLLSKRTKLAAAAIVSAVENALAPFAIKLGDYPLRPDVLIEMIGTARR